MVDGLCTVIDVACWFEYIHVLSL